MHLKYKNNKEKEKGKKEEKYSETPILCNPYADFFFFFEKMLISQLITIIPRV